MKFSVANLGKVGFISEEGSRFGNPVGALKASNNVRCDGLNVKTILPPTQLFTVTGSAGMSLSLAIVPTFFHPIQFIDGNTGAKHYFVYADNNYLYGTSEDSRKNNLTRTSGGADVLYSADSDFFRWSGEVINGLPVMVNGWDSPQVQLTKNLTTRFQNMRWDDSASTTWATRTAGAVACRVMTSLEKHFVALNTKEAGTYFLSRVRWSGPTLTLTQPTTWDDERLDTVADYYDIDETTGEIYDAVPLGRKLIIYKSDSIWSMTWVGGDSVFQFERLFDWGPASRDCVVSLGNTHIVLTANDVLEHDGLTYRSLAVGKIKTEIARFGDNNGIYRLAWHEKERELMVFSGFISSPWLYSYDLGSWTRGPAINFTSPKSFIDDNNGINNGKKLAYIPTSTPYIYTFSSVITATSTLTTTGNVTIPLLLYDREKTKLADMKAIKEIKSIVPYYECSGSAVLTLSLRAYHSPEYPTGRVAGTTMTLSQSDCWRLNLQGRDFDLSVGIWGIGAVRLFGFDVEFDFIGER